MKYISLLGIITIIALCAEFVLQMSGGDAIESFNAGRETGAQQAESGASYVHSFLLPVKAKVIPEGMEGEATLQLADGTKTVPYSIAEVKCEVRPSWFIAIALTFGSFFVALIGIYSIYCLIRLLIRVAKRDIFSRRNVYWIRWFAYVNAGIYLVIGARCGKPAPHSGLSGHRHRTYRLRFQFLLCHRLTGRGLCRSGKD